MLNANLYFTNTKKLILFFLIFFISRLIVYFNFIDQTSIGFDKNFLIALDNNFLEYFLFFHSLPLGNIIVAKIYLIFSEFLNAETYYYILNCFYSLISFFIIYNLYLKLFKKFDTFIYLIFIFYLLAIIPYETWRLAHHDHINIFLFTYLIYFIYNFIFLNNKNNYHFIIIFILFTFFYSSGFLIFIETTILILFFNFIKKNKLENWMKFFILTVLMINSLILIKNNHNIKSPSPTSVMNAVLLQKVHHALGDEKYRNNLKKSNLPKFLNKCLSDIYSNKTNSENYFEDITLFKCFYDKQKDHYDYAKIIDILKNFNVDDETINQVREDEIERNKKPWKFTGGYKEYNDRTGHIFQSETKKIYLNSFINYPYEMLIGKIGSKGFLLTFIQTGSWGGLFPNYYEKHLKLDNKFFNLINIIFALINIFFILYFIFKSIYKIIIIKENSYLKSNLFQFNLIILFYIIAFLFVNSNVTCCENPRMTVMIFYLFMINSFINLRELIYKNK
tara:strand:- start:9078 stop:10592 length:1515 start_codon:yes stop_codon:yes gene_type:complete